MSEPINFVKIFVCDYIEDIEGAVNDYAKVHRCTPVSASVTCSDTFVSATVVFKKKV